MQKAPNTKPLELEVSDFGPITEAKIELRPLTVFVGPGNTGKSYLAILIYALHRFLGPGTPGLGIGRRFIVPSSLSPPNRRGVPVLSDEKWDTLLHWVRDNAPIPGVRETPDRRNILVPDEIAALVRPVFENMDNHAIHFDTEIRRCFGVDEIKQLIRRPSTKGVKVTLKSHVDPGSEDAKPLAFTFTSRGATPSFSASIPPRTPLYAANIFDPFFWPVQRTAGMLSDREQATEDETLKLSLLLNLFEAVFTSSVGDACRPAHYLPADRTGVMHAHRVVVRSLIERATAAGLRPASPMPALSGVMADFLEQLISFGDDPRGRHNPNQDLVNKLEKEVLTGSVHMEKSEVEYPRFFYTPQGWKKEETLPLMNASSMVSELAPVVLYLRYVVNPGDLLIIEEPESHLHPAMQVEFIRNLAAAVQSGIRVLITTHSEWVLEEVANLVSISNLPGDRRKGIDSANISLPESDVGAWLFNPSNRPRGSKVEEIRLDRESGTFPSGFSQVSEALYNKWAEITNRIEESQLQ